MRAPSPRLVRGFSLEVSPLSQREFILAILDLAGTVPGLNPAAAAAHAANESAYGGSQLAAKHHNLFGTKATGQLTPWWRGDKVSMPTWEVIDGKTVQTTAQFRAYPSWRESLGDYSDVIARVYPWAAVHTHDPLAFLFGVFLKGPYRWATDPDAFRKAALILDAQGLLEPLNMRALGRHELLVDNSPTVTKGMSVISAALRRQPALLGPHYATRTPRPDGSWKLDLRAAE